MTGAAGLAKVGDGAKGAGELDDGGGGAGERELAKDNTDITPPGLRLGGTGLRTAGRGGAVEVGAAGFTVGADRVGEVAGLASGGANAVSGGAGVGN